MENWLLPVRVFGLLMVSPEISKDHPLNLYFPLCLFAKKQCSFNMKAKIFVGGCNQRLVCGFTVVINFKIYCLPNVKTLHHNN